MDNGRQSTGIDPQTKTPPNGTLKLQASYGADQTGAPSAPVGRARAPRVLIVDDDETIRRLLESALQNAGMVCDMVDKGESALARLSQEVYDLVILDLVLPGMSGLHVAESLRLRHVDTRVLIMTGFGNVDTAVEALRIRADDYLRKPFTIPELIASVERSLKRREALCEIRLSQREFARQIEQLEMKLERRFVGGILALMAALEARDRYTRGHSVRVTHMAMQLARLLDFPPEDIENIGIGALLHDIGKIAIPDSILLKNGRLTSDEYEKVQDHPRVGHDILVPFFGTDLVTDCALYHHERWDGKGYPQGLVGENCKLAGRLIAVCDAFDAMTSERPYRPAFSHARALEELCSGRAAQFDPQLDDLFCEARPWSTDQPTPTFGWQTLNSESIADPNAEPDLPNGPEDSGSPIRPNQFGL